MINSVKLLTSRDAVVEAMIECDQLGRDEFLKKYGFERSRRYPMLFNGKTYDSKAIVGVAYGKQYGEPLKFNDFTGGAAMVLPALERLGFKVLTQPKASAKSTVVGIDEIANFDSTVTEPGEVASLAPTRVTWSRDELILALDLYMLHRSKPLLKNAPEIAELSQVLNRLGRALNQRSSDTYRNEAGVYMKLMNFRTSDPDYVKDGRKGLARNNRDEAVVWDLYAGDPTALSAVAQLIRATILAYENDEGFAKVGEPEIPAAEEGRMVTKLHTYRERDRRIVADAKKAFLRKHNRLFCEVCNFDFSQRYGAAGEGIIDVHHTKPVHTLTPGELTKASDLALLCANCHRVVHSRRKWLTLAEVRALIENGN